MRMAEYTRSARCDRKVNIMAEVWLCYYIRLTGLLLWTCAHSMTEARSTSPRCSVQWPTNCKPRLVSVAWRNKLEILDYIDPSVGKYILSIVSQRFILSPIIYQNRDISEAFLYIVTYCVQRCRGRSVGIATGYGIADRGVGVRVPAESRIFCSPWRPGRFWNPHSLFCSGRRSSLSMKVDQKSLRN
jgi:hypothetical protein